MKTDILRSLEYGDFSKGNLIKALLLKGKGQDTLFELARKKRSLFFPSEEVEVRSVIEISNICMQICNFCNINRYSRRSRYIVGYDELIRRVSFLYKRNRRVLLIQSGENRNSRYIGFVVKCIKDIKRKFPDFTLILNLGNLSCGQYAQLKKAGADRYLLKFETSNTALYRRSKPCDTLNDRVRCLRDLEKVGFVVGSGNIIGLPGQKIDDITDDLAFMGKFDLAMGSTSVFIPGEETRYRNKPIGDIDVTLNYTALMRLMYPKLLIPTTSSLENAKKDAQYLGLMAGANTVTIHDGTMAKFKKDFPIYSVNRFIPNEAYIKRIVKKAGLKLRREAYHV